MKQKLKRYVTLGLSLSVFSALFLTRSGLEKQEKQNDSTIAAQRALHAQHLKNSPFTETLKLSKAERKSKGLPPNKYYEQMWELTLNPQTGKTSPENVHLLQQKLRKEISKRAPGDAANNPWIERGPNDIGGRTRAIMFDPNDNTNRRVFAGGVSGGLWVNDNITAANSQWSRIENVPGNLSVTSITVDPRNSNTFYIGTGEQYTAGDVVGNGVYRSTDGGSTWQAVNIPAAGPATFEFSATNLFLSGIFFVNDVTAWNNTAENRTELFVGVGAHIYGDASNPTNRLGYQTAGLYRSIDGGANWNRIESANLRFTFSGANYYYIPNDLEIASDNSLWMGTIETPGLSNGGGRVFSSTNGATWTEATASPLPDSNRVELETSATDANTMYALTEGLARNAQDRLIDPVHIYRTTNRFGAVTETTLPNDVDTGIPANDFTRGQSFYNLMIEADPTNDDILYVGGIDLFRSTNSGNSWTQISKWSNNNNLAALPVSLVHADQHAMVFRPGNTNQAIFGNDGGVFYANSLSTAGNNNVFGARNNNYNVTQYVKAAIGPNGVGDTAGIFTAGAQDNGSQAFRNVTPGINGSEELSDGDGFYTFVDRDGQFMIATFLHNIIYRFNLPWDGRSRIQGGATTLSNDDQTGDFVNQMGYDSQANFLLSNASSGTNFAIRTIDVANDRNSDIRNALLTAKPTALTPSPFANNTWLIGTANGGLLRLTNVGLGTANWAAITTPFVGSVSSVRFGATANDIMVTMHNYGVTSIWSSTNGGTNWVNKEGNLPDIPVRDILQNPLDRDEVIVGTQLGVWVTTNFNATNPTWSRSQNGMSDASVTSFDYWAINGDDNNNRIIASTYGRGVFTGSFTSNSNTPSGNAQTAFVSNSIPGTIQAENYDNGGQGVAYNDTTNNNIGGQGRTNQGVDITNTPDAGGGQIIGWTANGEWLEYTIGNVTPGTYNVTFRVASNVSNTKSIEALLGSQNLGNISIGNTGGWQTFTDLTLNNVLISNGNANQILRLNISGGSYNINWVQFEAVTSAQTAFAVQNIPGTIELENYDNGGQDVAYNDVDTSNNGGQGRTNEAVDVQTTTDAGGGTNVGWVANGEWLEYTIANTTAGTYAINIRVASPRNTAKSVQVSLDDVNLGTVAVPNTGGWQTWQTITIPSVTVSGGSNKVLRLTMVGGSFNINSVQFSSSVRNTAITSIANSNANSKNKASISLYPNPAIEKVQIDFGKIISTKVPVQFFDHLGRAIKSVEINTNNQSIDIQDLTTGLYFIKIGLENQTIQKTLVKR